MQIDPKLKDWCTPRQAEMLDAINEHGSGLAAADALGVHRSYPSKILAAVKKKAAMEGYAPEHGLAYPIPPGYKAKGYSTLRDLTTGEAKIQWEKITVDDLQREEMLREAYEAMAGDLPRAEPVSPPDGTLPHLCNVYTLTDSHIGMLSWPKETGAAWDLEIAERVLSGCFEQMVNACPPAKRCVIAQLGDWLHYDSLLPETPTSRHVLDADGRFPKMVQVAIRVLRRIIDYAPERHEEVTVLLAEGNHDLASSVWLRCMFRALYENEPRVTVIDSEHPYYCLQHGETMLVWHHGHLKKPQGMVELAAAEFPKEWGATTKRYAHLGDKHHGQMKEYAGIIVEQHSTLASRDAYSSRHGWQSLRRAIGITYHDKHGEVARATVSPEMLEAA